MSESPFALTGRTAAVTGGGRGLGRGISEALLEAGADVVVLGRSELPESLVSHAEQLGRSISLAPVDLSDPGAIDAVARAEVTQFAQAIPYVLDGCICGNPLGQPVGADPDRHGTRVLRQEDPLLAALDILLPHVRIHCLELADRAVAQQTQLAGF